MTRTVSTSQTGQNLPPPSRKERDDAASSDAGRKAVEEPIKVSKQKESLQNKCRKDETKAEEADTCAQPPIGLELETLADDFTEER